MRLRLWFKQFVAKWKRNAREQRIIKNCNCICWCPRCGDPLNDQATMTKAGTFDNLVVYVCGVCKRESRWDFNHPVPICLDWRKP